MFQALNLVHLVMDNFSCCAKGSCHLLLPFIECSLSPRSCAKCLHLPHLADEKIEARRHNLTLTFLQSVNGTVDIQTKCRLTGLQSQSSYPSHTVPPTWIDQNSSVVFQVLHGLAPTMPPLNIIVLSSLHSSHAGFKFLKN